MGRLGLTTSVRARQMRRCSRQVPAILRSELRARLRDTHRALAMVLLGSCLALLSCLPASVPIVLAPGGQPREPQLNVAARSGDVAQVESLLKAGCDVNAHDFKSGDTPLLVAVQGNHQDVAAVLIAHGADVNAKNGAIQTALYAAKNKDMTEFLIAHGADLSVRDASGDTPLHDAVLNPDKMKVLLAHGADVNATNRFGNTPLYGSVTKETAEILIAHGAIVNAHNKDGETPLDWAIRAADAPLGTHNRDVVKVLLARGAIASKNDPAAALESTPSH